eukprot:353710-Chlamydomonas_euryale.AAC.9
MHCEESLLNAAACAGREVCKKQHALRGEPAERSSMRWEGSLQKAACTRGSACGTQLHALEESPQIATACAGGEPA